MMRTEHKFRNESLWAMCETITLHYKERYPEQGAMLDELEHVLKKALHLAAPSGGGGVGLYRGWNERIQEIVDKFSHRSCSKQR